MLTPREVKPFLVHEDGPVRDAAVGYFKGSWSEDPDLLPLALRAYRQYGPEEARYGVACCSQFTLIPQHSTIYWTAWLRPRIRVLPTT